MRSRNEILNPTVVICVALVVFFIVNGPPSDASNRQRTMSDPTFSKISVFSRVDGHNVSSVFRSAKATAVMGSVGLDFRDATMEGSEATIDVTTIMGGIEIRVPQTWTVINRVTAVMGGVSDHSRAKDGNKRIIIEGNVLMGGVDIKN